VRAEDSNQQVHAFMHFLMSPVKRFSMKTASNRRTGALCLTMGDCINWPIPLDMIGGFVSLPMIGFFIAATRLRWWSSIPLCSLRPRLRRVPDQLGQCSDGRYFTAWLSGRTRHALYLNSAERIGSRPWRSEEPLRPTVLEEASAA
jgi:hypothetical protein